jgi:hypothetical protein
MTCSPSPTPSGLSGLGFSFCSRHDLREVGAAGGQGQPAELSQCEEELALIAATSSKQFPGLLALHVAGPVFLESLHFFFP